MQQPMADDVGVYMPTAAEDAYKPEFKPKFEATPYNFAVTLWNMNYSTEQAGEQVNIQVSTQVNTQVNTQVARVLAAIGDGELTAGEIMEALGFSERSTFRKNYLHPALESSLAEMTIPDKPNSRLQRYRRATREG